MRPRSALLITPRWTRDGGVGAHVTATAAALSADGVSVSVLTARIDDRQHAHGVKIHRSARLLEPGAPVEERLADAGSAHDVIHLHHHQPNDPTLVDSLRPIAPVVISAHGFIACTSQLYYFQPGEECVRGHGIGCVPNLLARGCAHTRTPRTLPRKYRNATRAHRALERADLAVSYSSAIDRHLAANRIERRAIVPYFPTIDPVHGSGHETRRRVVFAGRIVRPKGVDVLLTAAAEVDAEFVLCGDGRELEAMRRLAQDLRIGERVRFTGWLEPSTLARELAEASVVVVPSLWPEPFGLVGIEGFAAARPAVASATGGIPDWLEHGVSGLTVPPGDPRALARALGEMLGDVERQQAMGRAGQRTVQERFSRERHLAVLLQAYEDARATWSQRGRRAA